VNRYEEKLKKSPRPKYPFDEAKYDWLPILLDTYHIVDIGISIELPEEEKRRGAKTACHEGCSNCCLNPIVPITPLELSGISWYASEKLMGDLRTTLKKQLLNHTKTSSCPFLVDALCAIYPLRPLACRQFFVFNKPCGWKEDISKTRPHDAWTHSRSIARRAAIAMLPFYSIKKREEQIKAFENGYIAEIAKPMHRFPWEQIYKIMLAFDH